MKDYAWLQAVGYYQRQEQGAQDASCKGYAGRNRHSNPIQHHVVSCAGYYAGISGNGTRRTKPIVIANTDDDRPMVIIRKKAGD